jgi:hypothetical protein
VTEVNLVRRLRAAVELDYRIPMKIESALYVIRALAPSILALMREELVEAKREWTKQLERQR